MCELQYNCFRGEIYAGEEDIIVYRSAAAKFEKSRHLFVVVRVQPVTGEVSRILLRFCFVFILRLSFVKCSWFGLLFFVVHC